MRISGLLLSAFAFMPVLVSAQGGGFIVKLGNDTLAIEQFQRSGNRVEGTVVRHSPQTTQMKYVVTLNTDGTVASYQQTTLRGDGSPLPTAPVALTMMFHGDSVMRQVMQNGQAVMVHGAAPRGTVPAMGLSWLGSELIVKAARGSGVAYTLGLGAQATPTKLEVRYVGNDSAEIVQQGFRTGMKVDREGHILRGDGSLTTQKWVVTPLPNVDLSAITAAWAAKDASGQAMGAASTRDTVNAVVGGANIWIDYGRPAKRGREIWGKLVPYDTTWRLGANSATQFKTDKDLVMGGVTVPAGMYTLWLYPTAKESFLIVNKQVGQWGTAYDASQDLVKIPLTPHMSLKESEERFHVFVQGDQLMMHWDKGGYGVKVAAK